MAKIEPKIVFSRRYDIGLFGLERLHPFDTRKYSRAYRLLKREFDVLLPQLTISPRRPVGRRELLAVHSPQYLQRLRDPAYVAKALEIAPVRWMPAWIINWRILRPMRWATAGTALAAEHALRSGLAINMSGGYHHASRDRGEGFCIYSDIALSIAQLRRSGALSAGDRVVYIDLDAHQGNGVCHQFCDDRSVFILDAYNQSIYPAHDLEAKRRIDCPVPLPNGCHEADYLGALRSKLPAFLNAVNRGGEVRFAIYNAGTDIFRGDALGGMNVSAEGVIERDQLVIEQLVDRQFPTLMLLSGGYSRESYKLVAGSIARIMRRWMNLP